MNNNFFFCGNGQSAYSIIIVPVLFCAGKQRILPAWHKRAQFWHKNISDFVSDIAVVAVRRVCTPRYLLYSQIPFNIDSCNSEQRTHILSAHRSNSAQPIRSASLQKTHENCFKIVIHIVRKAKNRNATRFNKRIKRTVPKNTRRFLCTPAIFFCSAVNFTALKSLCGTTNSKKRAKRLYVLRVSSRF